MSRPSLGSTPLPHFAGLSFLLVEDDRDSRGFISELLRVCGALVVEADSVRAARAFVGTMKFDMIVTDLALPGEDGAMSLTWLREQPRDQGGSVPAGAITAFYDRYPGPVVGAPLDFAPRGRVYRRPVGRDGLLIGEVARRSGASRKALRLYEAAGILPARRTASGYRVYGADALGVLSFVRKAQGLGFTLGEIKDIVSIRRSGRAPCPHVCDLVRRKTAELDRKLADLAEVRRGLRRLLNDWRSWDGAPAAVCPHIERDNRRRKSDGNREGAVVSGRLQPVPQSRVRR